MTERIRQWVKQRDNETLIRKPDRWLLRPYLLGFLVVYFFLLVAVAMVVPLTLSIGSVVVITTSFSLLVSIVVFKRQFVYFTYRLGDQRLFRLFFTNTIAIFLLTFSIIVVPLILNFRVQIKVDNREQSTEYGSNETSFLLDINQVYLYLLQEEAGALSRKMDRAAQGNPSVSEYSPSDSTANHSEYQKDNAETILFQMVKDFENSYRFYDMDIEKSEVPHEFYKKALDDYGLSVKDISENEAVDILVVRQRMLNPYLPLSRDSLQNPKYSKLIVGLAKCFLLKDEVSAMTNILTIAPILLIVAQLVITTFISIMIFIICFWKKIIVVPMIVSLLATFVILALMSIILSVSSIGENGFFWILLIGLTCIFVFGFFASPDNKIQRGLMIMSNVIGTTLFFFIQLIIIATLPLADEFEKILLVAAFLNLLVAIGFQRHFIRKYVNLKFAPEKS